MAKVYNKKKGMYKGSLPGMRAGGSLPKAQTNIDPDIYTLGTDSLGNPIEGSPSGPGKPPKMTEQDLVNRLDSLQGVNRDTWKNYDALSDEFRHVGDSLDRDERLKWDIEKQEMRNQNLENETEKQRLEIACMRGDESACAALGKTPRQIQNESWEERMILREEEEENATPMMKEVIYKRGGVVKKKRGGTILGGKYKMKKGGSTGRNGIL
jgi:hypothetical protein